MRRPAVRSALLRGLGAAFALVGVAAALAWTWSWWTVQRGEGGPSGLADVALLVGLTAGAPFAIAIGAGLLVTAAGQPWRTLDTVAVIVGGLVVLVPSLLALS